MIPVRLQLKNFMSYGTGVPPLELAGVRLACLSGDNGNGKTALLDAMTWALFGETRASSEDDIVRLGADDCAVLLDFIVGGDKYRVKRQRGKRGGAVWELQIWQEDGSLRSLSGTNARETKSKIEHLLRMDYRTFLASGYLAQGRADEFARATVTDRKKVLADILDLSRYERLEELAKEKRKEAEDRELDAERTLRTIEAELENEDRYYLALEAAQKKLTEIHAETENLRAQYEKFLAQIERMESDEQKAADLEERIREVLDEMERNRRSIIELEKRIAVATLMTDRRAEIEAAHSRFVSLGGRIKELTPQYEEAVALEREARGLETEIREEQVRLDRERYRLQCDVETLEGEAKELGRYDAEVIRIEKQVAEIGNAEARRTDAEEKRSAADERVVALKAEYGALKAQAEAVLKRQNALAESDASLCDYCGQPLPPAERARAIAEAQTEHERLDALQDKITAGGRDAKRLSDQFRADAEKSQGDLRAIARLEAQKAQASQEQLRLIERTKMLPDLKRRLDRFARQLSERDFAHAPQERLVQVSARLEKLERVAQQLTDARSEQETLRETEKNLLLLQQAAELLETEPLRVTELHTLVAKREGQMEKAQRQIADIRARTAALPALRGDQVTVSTQLSQAQAAAREAERQAGQFAGKLENCVRLKEERIRWLEARLAAAKEKDQYKELVGAFGKKGVQALIIENALPEIEEQANSLLAKMTDGAMHIRLVTQREAKSKTASGPIETLDIVISDDLGTRPYEMYSGGEAFRINFALRVALSKLLARRAGAPLQTLILDEGFGTQDPRGREAIVDAIQTISEDFALILVITHIDELKESFQTRIEVTKGQNGSTFTVS
ncbi:MAG: SMC family ATPase [Cytophagales bacterium]|nr:SMC family ATPase [Armatimonadota bacterium]